MPKKIMITMIASLVMMASSADAAREDLICLTMPSNESIEAMVYLDSKAKELVINGDSHPIGNSQTFPDAIMLDTVPWRNPDNQLVYITMLAQNSGPKAGIYMALMSAKDNRPISVLSLNCHHYTWKRKP